MAAPTQEKASGCAYLCRHVSCTGQKSLIWMPSPPATDQHHNQVNHSDRETGTQRKTESTNREKERKQKKMECYLQKPLSKRWALPTAPAGH